MCPLLYTNTSSELRLRMFIKSEVSAIDSIDLRIKAEIIEDNL